MEKKDIKYIQHHYLSTTSPVHRKQLGQYFTPAFISDLFVQWITACPHIDTVLEPSIGLGHLVESLPDDIKVEGYDIDPLILSAAQQYLQHKPNLILHEQDFLMSNWEQSYDGIVCNPPYVTFRKLKEKKLYNQLFQEQLGMKFSGFSNLYAFFLFKALHQLSSNGRAAFIVPSDFLNAGYGEKIKSFFLNEQNLHLIVVADFKQGWFDDAITTSCLLFFDNQVKAEQMEFIQISQPSEIHTVQHRLKNFYEGESIGKTVPYHQLDPSIKWRAFYQNRVKSDFQGLKPLSTFAKVTRGIATGANHFFCFDEEKRQAWGLGSTYFRPCVTKSHQLKTNFFSTENYQQLVSDGAPVQLLTIQEKDSLDPNVHKYLTFGEENKVNERYLTKNRRPWYKSEHREPAPILVNVFSRNQLRFIRNEANVYHLTAFHGIYVHPAYDKETDILMAYFLTDICHQIVEEQHREYGSGLKKLEPNDLNQAPVIDLDEISTVDKQMIRKLYANIRNQQLQKKVIEPSDALEELNQIFKQLMIKNK
ncbi:HsdM family class I SAM-dependent methyltransferase [Aquibacillus albus]|uniref:site-specific DNA-methyltransferase (adenine-specific) n=1 Tax=Aquibacillus albus TaxID=1168171 RepID=A0ABS2MXE1_9BACI|nr:N-6 DNA methylase [Aquibacillus albus]MBM7570535.1 adenine-specific DNA-methyltransferase [Aquibacillus albus]